MSDISTKLTYLNETKGKIKDAINLTNANILSEDTFRSYAEKLKLGLVDIINNGVDNLYNTFPKTTGTGTEIALNDTYEAPMKLNEIDGDTLQDGTPTPDNSVEIESVTGRQEIEICGKNLFDKDNANILNAYVSAGRIITSSPVDRLIYIPCKPDTTYTVQKMKQATTNRNRFRLGTTSSIPKMNDTINQFWNAGDGSTVTEHTITTNSTANYLICYCYSSDTITTFEEMLASIQIEEGSTATTYEPYQSQEYDINLGKNLLNIPDGSYTQNEINIDVVNGKITINGTATANTNIKISNLKITKKGTYTISPNINTSSYGNNLQLGGYVYNSDGSYKENIDIRSANKTKTISNGEYITNFWVYILNGTTFNNFEVSLQLEKGSQATSYSPYFTPIELCKIGNYQDYLYKDDGKWYKHSEIGKVVLDGTQSIPLTNWRASETSVGWVYGYNVFKAKTNAPSVVGAVMSNKLIAQKFDDLFNKNVDNGIATYSNTDYGFTIRTNDTTLTTTTAINNYLSSNPITTYYALETPTDELITDDNLIEQLELLYNAKSHDGTTNISITSEDLPMILNVSALSKN